MKKQLFSILLVSICMMPLLSFNLPVFVPSNHNSFKFAPGSQTNTYIGDVEDVSAGAYYQVYENGSGGIAEIYFEDIYGDQGPGGVFIQRLYLRTYGRNLG